MFVVKREVLEKLLLKYPQLGKAKTLHEFHELLIKFAKKEGYKVVDLSQIEPGIKKVLEGRCPRGATSPLACWFCPFGHATECHFPLTCEEAKCSHYQKEG